MNLIIIPEHPSEEVILSLLRVQWPNIYKNGLRSVWDGPVMKKETEERIATAKAQYYMIRQALIREQI